MLRINFPASTMSNLFRGFLNILGPFQSHNLSRLKRSRSDLHYFKQLRYEEGTMSIDALSSDCSNFSCSYMCTLMRGKAVYNVSHHVAKS